MAKIITIPGKKGKTYKVQIRLSGQKHYIKTFKSFEEAKAKAVEVEKQIRDGRYDLISESSRRKLSEAIQRYRKYVLPNVKKSKREHILDWWDKMIGHLFLKQITPALLSEIRDKLLHAEIDGKKRAVATVVKFLATLSHILSVASNEWQWLESNPLSKVSKPTLPRGRTRFLDDDERERLLQACRDSQNPYLYTIVVLAISTGTRRGELVGLRWEDVDFERERLVLRETKNGEVRVIPLVGLAQELLRELYANRKISSFLLFPGTDPSKPLDFRSAWRRAVKAANLKNFVYHDLRHCFGSYMIMNGTSINVVGDLLGHKSNVTKRYVHLSDAYSKDVVTSMNEKIFNREAL